MSFSLRSSVLAVAVAVSLQGAGVASPPGPSIPAFFFSSPDSPNAFIGASPTVRTRFEGRKISFQHGPSRFRIEFAGARPDVTPQGRKSSGAVNILRGTDAASWRTRLAIYSSLTYSKLYNGIDLEYRYDGPELKSEYSVAPGADPRLIRCRYEGGSPAIAPDGSLVVRTKAGEFREAAPYIYQVVNGTRRQIPGGYRLEAHRTVGFQVGPYDRSLPLIIDPLVTFSTFWGGTQFDALTGVATLADGTIFVTGWTESYDATASNAFQTTLHSPTDAFVMHLSASGATVLYATFLGGTGSDAANAIAVDATGNAYIVGYTSSTDFPVIGAAQSTNHGGRDAFVCKLSATGGSLVYSTYWGGAQGDIANAIAVDTSGNAYVAGNTLSTNFPIANAFQATNHGGQDAFLLKLNSTGSTALYSTYIGGSGTDQANGVAVDVDRPIVAGGTDSTNFPTLNAAQPANKGGQDAFVLKMTNTGAALVYSTYFGGSSGSSGLAEMAFAVAVNSAGEAYVGGTTSSLDFPTLSAYSATFNGGTNDGFLARFSTSGTLQFSTYLGGASYDSVNAVAVDASGTPYVAGATSSSNFPTVLPIQVTNKGQFDAFIASFSTTGNSLLFSTFWGGSGSDSALGISVSGSNVVVAGQTLSGDFPLKGAFQSVNAGNYGGFVTSFSSSLKGLGKVGIFRAGLWVVDANGNGIWDGSPPDKIINLGQSGDIPVVGDWNGDGHLKAGIFRAGLWVLDYNGNGQWDGPPTDRVASLGQAGDIPVVGDWNGDGRAKIGIFRAGLWVLDYNGNGQWDGSPTDMIANLGQGGDTPIVGDWSGNGKAKVGVYRAGLWVLDYNGNGQWDGTPTDVVGSLGQAGDVPVLGDWNGDKRTKIGIFRNGLWLLDYNGNGLWDGTPTDKFYSLGLGTDTPVAGDWNGDGRAKIGVFRNGTWYLDFNGDGQWRSDLGEVTISIGQAGDTPVVGPW